MPNRPLVLHFGSDALLAEARVLVLEDAGYEVVSADSTAAAVSLLRTRQVALVIACHSVPPDELETAVAQVRQLRPRVPVIAVHVGSLVRPQRELADGFVDGLRGPEHLLRQVASVLRRDTRAAAG